jgi:tRNA-uridine 2-sulfurtransferase
MSDQKVYVGMSGGVDSSVAAGLLKQQGYRIGIYMKNWSQDLPGMPCPWKDDFQDAKRVAVQLGIDFKMYDFEKQYRQRVVDYMVEEYRAGRTPNPDVMCNQEVKFRLFLDTALEDGADMIATGHYARVINREAGNSKQAAELHVAKNIEKDQSYFLYRVSEQALARTLMPIGEFTTKSEVRALAKKMGLATADKKDSQGICFVGKVGIRDFLLHELGPQIAGPIIDQYGKTVGEHDGAIFYTIGQRHGLSVGGGLPYYVTGKDMAVNEVYVTTNLDDDKLWCSELNLTDLHWINGEPMDLNQESGIRKKNNLQVRTRYRAPLVGTNSLIIDKQILRMELEDQVRAVTPGQSAVIYKGDRVVGGGIVL